MPIEIVATSPGVLDMVVSGKLTDTDYKVAVPWIEQAIADSGKLRILFEMKDFHGWDAHALWDDFKFGIKHNDDVERIAMVGDRAWESWMARLGKPFIKAESRYFDLHELEAARQWVNDGGA